MLICLLKKIMMKHSQLCLLVCDEIFYELEILWGGGGKGGGRVMSMYYSIEHVLPKWNYSYCYMPCSKVTATEFANNVLNTML